MNIVACLSIPIFETVWLDRCSTNRKLGKSQGMENRRGKSKCQLRESFALSHQRSSNGSVRYGPSDRVIRFQNLRLRDNITFNPPHTAEPEQEGCNVSSKQDLGDKYLSPLCAKTPSTRPSNLSKCVHVFTPG